MFKKSLLIFIFLVFIGSNCYAYNPNSFEDEETVDVRGRRPKVDIVVSEIIVNINPEDFVNGIFEKSITVSNDGNVPCTLDIEVQNVPIDLIVKAGVDSDFLTRGESTNLNIYVELTDMQEVESFEFKIIVEARLR